MSPRPNRPRPWVLAIPPLLVLQVAGTFGAFASQVDSRPPPLALAIAVAGPLLLLLFERSARLVMAATAALTCTYVLAGYPYGPVFATLSVVSILTVLRGHRYTVWAGLGVLLVVTQVQLVRDDDWSWAWLSGASAWLLLLVSISELVRVRGERVRAARAAERESRRRAAGEERLAIARELHDVVAHHMSLINVQAGVALHLVDRRPEQVQTALAVIKDASREALAEMRSLVGVLRDEADPAPRAPGESLAALDDLAERGRLAGLEVVASVDVPRPVPAAVELAALRIAQEAVTNAVRHAEARHVDIVVRLDADELTVRVDDDGRGAPAGLRPGNGVIGMTERADALGGRLTIGASPRGGVSVHAHLPIGDDS
ncbi:sensor histidine kinase [Aeromicrobium wangtongii]|uniref:sensor histidine kinase n=1 Tax=Aeromicrobium wangtongii TaxID=2969247 RepID=UPI0020173391|nr:sensor histidine kinase [Aeromicrobium wangtongii]MCL3818072.1 sensor histidine kinase [Aeromicrobium wangtongii]